MLHCIYTPVSSVFSSGYNYQTMHLTWTVISLPDVDKEGSLTNDARPGRVFQHFVLEYWSQLISTFPPMIDYSLTVSVWLPTIWATKKMSSPLPLPKDPQDPWQEKKNFKPHGMTSAQTLLSHAWVLFMIYSEWRLVLYSPNYRNY